MKKMLLFLLLVGGLVSAQKERIQIQGVINSTTNEPLEGVTVFNLSSLEGTVTNEEGGFFIHAREKDQLSFKAVQLESFSLTITKNVIEDRKIIISLSEGVNQLDEVVLVDGLMRIKVKKTTYVDPKIDEVSEFNVKTRAVDRMENTMSDRIKQPEEYAVRNEAFNQSQPRFNMSNIFGALASLALLGTLEGLDVNTGSPPKVDKEKFDVYMLKNKYRTEYLLEYLKIPEEHLFEFMYFSKDNGLNASMFEPERELDLLQFLSNQVTLFKSKKNYYKETEGLLPSQKEKSNEK
ncbi:carboxypeptidase-like regulatory domain-containing protein [Nonlabens sp.]|uniref:carboxypeptidase-like regulatory domain-containing protein n=1 Tax=Nonlabens sp. TaxID=1888209 RepID=UPI001BD1AEA0|nr:carboxypeptidase-like regulatory domain-containing protein [Nonlabens sp.]